jgi:hypothetical protein
MAERKEKKHRIAKRETPRRVTGRPKILFSQPALHFLASSEELHDASKPEALARTDARISPRLRVLKLRYWEATVEIGIA